MEDHVFDMYFSSFCHWLIAFRVARSFVKDQQDSIKEGFISDIKTTFVISFVITTIRIISRIYN